MRGAVSADSGRQTHPCAQPLVAVFFAVAVLVADRVAAHVRCPVPFLSSVSGAIDAFMSLLNHRSVIS